jgi:hypothetical protein
VGLDRTLRLRISGEQVKQLESLAAREGVSVSALARKALDAGGLSVRLDLSDPSHVALLGRLVSDAVRRALEEQRR